MLLHMRARYREEPCKSALNRVKGMDFNWSLNPYMGCAHQCAFCYVRAFEERADRPGDSRYGTDIRVKTNVVEVLRFELSRPTWAREDVAVGAATDPYQPIEGTWKLTRGCIQAFAEARNPFGLITRGPLVLRDLDVLQEASRRAEVAVHFSIPTLDMDVWRKTEPGTAPPQQRLRVLKKLVDGGVRAGVGMAPILPGISDRPEQLAEVVRAAREAGAVSIWAGMLYLRGATRTHFLDTVAKHWPEQLPRYEKLYATRIHLGSEHTQPLKDEMAALKRRYPSRGRPSLIEPPPEPEQLALAI